MLGTFFWRYAAIFGKRKTMFLKTELQGNVVIPAESLDAKGLMLQKAIFVRLLDDFAKRKATKDLGYLLALKTVEKIGEGKVRQHTGDVLFPVTFSAISFKLFRGEILEGVVHKVLKQGVMLRCGPIENVYLSSSKMPDFNYVPGENPVFYNNVSKIEKGVTLRVIVIGAKWLEAEREFQALVGLHADYLGPVP
ncbi:DNA-directed RNA polymerase V subunit 7-like isoform X1 [Argentina anserina]|uniref:DNA-directed RNA polymerase V subunit 7-like isoform X1 n=2 Tax=Argentina anserina TaxID=57926 RepID=UPI0021762B16|nr:DNA-directed RNA polymerase V subunit 7-like isoform X1 [Potentilla anserina]